MEQKETRAQPLLYSNDDQIRNGNPNEETQPVLELCNTSLETFFEVDATILWIKENEYKRVALQFPDAFLRYASDVSQMIEEKSSSKTFILADTSYKSCCVDEIAAAHSSCDSIVHYGDACMSCPSTNIPVRYVLGRLPLNLDDFTNKISKLLDEIANEDRIVFCTDAAYSYAMDSSFSKITSKNENRIILAKVATAETQLLENEEISLGRVLPRSFTTSTESSAVLFIGDEKSPLLPLFLLTYPHCSKILHYDPNQGTSTIESSSSWRQLRRRLFLLEKMRDARTIGIVVGTVGIKGHREAVARLRMLCHTASKKAYVISVGKVNVAKLSNFSEIDAFVLISCPFGVLLETNDYFKPVVSMFEAEMALNPNKSWAASTGWSAEFEQILNDNIGEHKEDGRADLSLISGNIRVDGGQITKSDETDGADKQISLYSAGDYFKERTWHGLDDSIRIDEELKITEGRSGVAASYAKEGAKSE